MWPHNFNIFVSIIYILPPVYYSTTHKSATLIIHVALTAYYCRMMQQEYINFMHKRVDHLENGDDDTPTQTYFTVMVEHVPAVLRSNTHLSNFFNKLFPGLCLSLA